MDDTIICLECGAAQPHGKICQDDFHQLLYWETEFPELWWVHHYMVLCYHLQHPSLYSPEGLKYGRQLLKTFIEDGVSPEEVRKRNRNIVDSGQSNWKIIGDVVRGSWDCHIIWTMTVADVVGAGIENYCERVEAWAKSVHESLKVCDT